MKDICRNCSTILTENENWYTSFAKLKYPNRLCKPCAKVSQQAATARYNEAHRQERRDYQADYYKHNSDYVKARWNAYYHANSEEILKRQKAGRLKRLENKTDD